MNPVPWIQCSVIKPAFRGGISFTFIFNFNSFLTSERNRALDYLFHVTSWLMLAVKLTQQETTQEESFCEVLVCWGLSWLVTEVGGPSLNVGGAIPWSGPWLCKGESRCLSRDGNQGWLYSLCALDCECDVTSSLSSLALTPPKW